ncbi:MAG TPA: DUF3499 family protein [Egibacteraceae bacterium]|nr:DUF3499 family protein [Egibacteraceae bacterium]
MRHASRTCSRPACPAPATASLSYRYASGQVWIADLSPSPHPALYDLCARHADALTVPRGWQRVEQRSSLPDAAAPARPGRAEERAPVSAPLRRPAGTSRYDRLRRELPRIAAQPDERVPQGEFAPAAMRGAPTRRTA